MAVNSNSGKYKRVKKQEAKNELKKQSGLYGKKNLTGSKKKKHQTGWVKTVDGKKKTVAPGYFRNKKAAEAAGYTAEYQAHPTQPNRKGKIKKGGSVSGKPNAPEKKTPDTTEQIGRSFESSKDGKVKQTAQTPTYKAKTKEEEIANIKKITERLGSKKRAEKDPEFGKQEYERNKKLKEEGSLEYVKGSQTLKQIDANRTARRKAKAAGGEGTRTAYRTLKKRK